jgi:hypothetical protein
VNLEWFPQLENEMCMPNIWPCDLFALEIIIDMSYEFIYDYVISKEQVG